MSDPAPRGGPVVVGINRTQDGSICVMQGSRLLCAIQKERITRQKYHWGKLGDLRNVYCDVVTGLHQPVDALVECYSSDAEVQRLDEYEQEIAEVLHLAPAANARASRTTWRTCTACSTPRPSRRRR